MKKRFLAVALCLAAMIILVACQSSGAANEKLDALLGMDPPIPGITWGMTIDEVTAALEEAGVKDVPISNMAMIQMKLTYDQVATLGADKYLGLPVYTDLYPVLLRFKVDTTGTAYLSAAIVNWSVESREVATDVLTAQYGEPVDDNGYTWGFAVEKDNKTFELQIAANEPWSAGIQTIYIFANDYVMANFGNF